MTPVRTSLIAYGVVVLAIFFFIRSGGGASPSFVTTRQLEPDHRIDSSDVEVARDYHRGWDPSGRTIRDFNGRYVKTSVRANKPVDVQKSTLRDPRLLPPPGEGDTVVWLPIAAVAPPDVASLEPGISVDVCDGEDSQHPCVADVTVAAQWCDEKSSPACFIGLWVETAQAAKLFQALDKLPLASRASAVHIILHRRGGISG